MTVEFIMTSLVATQPGWISSRQIEAAVSFYFIIIKSFILFLLFVIVGFFFENDYKNQFYSSCYYKVFPSWW